MTAAAGDGGAPLLRVERLTTHYRVRRGAPGASRLTAVRAVEDVSFTVERGEMVGLVGESGSGKSTVGRSIARLETATSGRVVFDGEDVLAFGEAALQRYRRRMQVIFQDPASSLDPRMRVGAIVGEPLAVHRLGDRAQRRERVEALLREVGLGPDALRRYPREFSGGQRQRIGIARALAAGPDLIIADEPVSALDVSVQAQVINLLQALRQRSGLALLFISHDLPTVEFLCDRVVVMYLGRVVEIAPAADFQQAARHPYSRRLASDAPRFGVRLASPGESVQGPPPGLLAPAEGCVFRPLCPHAIAACGQAPPVLTPMSPGHAVACIRTELLS
ncbi:MAG TPA: ABC transporter ATP-binding protein [Caulobacteraceae bacterium]